MKRKIFWFISVILFLPVMVKADSISLKCPSEFETNVEFSCDVYGNSTAGIYNVETDIKITNFTYVTFTPESGLQGQAFYSSGTGSYKVLLYGATLLKNDFKIGTLRIKGASGVTTGKVTLSETVFSDDTKKVTVTGTDKTINLKQNTSGSGNTNNGTGGSSGGGSTNGGSTNKGTTGGGNTNGGSTNKGTTGGGNANGGSTNKGTTGGNTNKVITGQTDGTKDTETTEDDTNKTTEDDDTVEEYKIDFSKGAYLLDLRIDGYKIDFRSDVFQYNIKIKNEKQLKITPVVSSKNVTYTIIDNEDLKDGSIIKIEVIYKKKEMKTYYIKVEKNENKRILTFVLIGIIVVLALINIIRLFGVRRDNNDTESE